MKGKYLAVDSEDTNTRAKKEEDAPCQKAQAQV